MALEALSSNEFLNFIMYDSIIGVCNDDASATAALLTQQEIGGHRSSGFQPVAPPEAPSERPAAVQGRKKRRRRPRVCKNKEEAETQRMTHIAVERNRRKQMNEHLAVLRSLMPESYVQRGDQASIVGGAIEFVKELEHTLQSLEAKKHKIIEQQKAEISPEKLETDPQNPFYSTPFAQFFTYPQFSCSTGGSVSSSTSQLSSKYTSQSKAAIADIEVTLIETHANIRILSRKRVRQLSKIVAAFHSVCFTILHLNVTTLDSFVLYSISAKVEEGCQLNSADDIAGAVHHMLRIIEEEAILCC
ncbi:transcription factor bHLH71 [Primulina eburnea]|uniref:transcription factor bHLH71 n=1 Tax=Primulina eburnea TaxID=1245227 RepID=UPI003C6C9138